MSTDWKAIDEKMRLYASPEVSSEEKTKIRTYVWCALLDEKTEKGMFKKFINTDVTKNKKRNEGADQEKEKNRAAFKDYDDLKDRFSRMYLDLVDYTVNNYNLEKDYSFSKLFNWLAVRRGNDLFDETLMAQFFAESLDSEDENGECMGEKIGKAGSESTSDLLNDTAEWFFTFANMIMQARLRDPDGKRSEERLFYRSMFYSDTVSAAVRSVPDIVRIMSKNNRLLFKAMDVLFLDYIFIKQCRRIRDLAECETKRMCDMSEVNDPSEGCCKIPAPQKVFAGFMESVGKKADVTTISKRQKSYLKEIDDLKELLKADVR